MAWIIPLLSHLANVGIYAAQKEKNMTQLFEDWIEIFIQSKIIPETLFSSLLQEIDEIIRILVTTIKSSKENSRNF